MAPIRQLDDQVVALIAAGEVVERPVSVVKELAENAIDAGATSISVEIRRGGFDLVRVRDDGAGIEPVDMPLALARHATSKLHVADDLFTVRTLGFRGEALASIAAVSRLRITTRPASRPSGRILATTGGEVVEDGPAGAPPGTVVEVEDVFFNVPARHAFQRSAAGESRAIAALVSQLALATPHVRWRLTLDGRDSLVTPGDGSLREAFVSVHGASVAPHVLEVPEVAEADGTLTVTGVVGSPAVHRNVRSYCTFVINDRVVRSQVLAHAVEEAFHALLPGGRHPIAAIHLRVPPHEVDVNVHPTKLEVRLRRERLAYARIRDAVRQALATHSPSPVVTPVPATWNVPGTSPMAFAPRTGILLLDRGHSGDDVGALGTPARPGGGGGASLSRRSGGGTEGGGVLPSPAAAGEGPRTRITMVGASSPAPVGTDDHGPGPADAWSATDPSTWRPLGQVGLTYVVVEAPDGMYLIDQHSAHERVQYEALKASASSRTLHLQPLLVPEPVELVAAHAAWLRGNLAVLQGLGYDLEAFGDARGTETWLVRAVPMGVAARGRPGTIPSLIDGLIEREYGDGPIEDQARWAVACHSSVRAGDHLSLPEMQALLEHLARCDLRQTCPHGRPTMIHLSHSQLAREFGRSMPRGASEWVGRR